MIYPKTESPENVNGTISNSGFISEIRYTIISVVTMVTRLNVRAAMGSVMVLIIGLRNINPKTRSAALKRYEIIPPLICKPLKIRVVKKSVSVARTICCAKNRIV